jgi:tRNA-2-methylthio-N6-dimethylallyladenosine synthase
VAEANELSANGYREVTLLGQNVDSYKWQQPDANDSVNFARLLAMVAGINPRLRIRFSTSHPKDITDEVLHTIAKYPNICNYIHLPVQSGNSRVLEMMNRTYDSAWYQSKVQRIYEILPDCAISSDIIAGFCTETEEEHQDTLKIMRYANYSMSYMFMYSERPGTLAAKKYQDDIPDAIKKRRLAEIIKLQNELSLRHNQKEIGKIHEVLIEGDSKRSDEDYKGRTSQNKVVVFPKSGGFKPGDYVQVKIEEASSATLIGKIVQVVESDSLV